MAKGTSRETSQGAAAPAPAEVMALVERFRANLESYRDPAYKETRVRREFLDPFFEALGWDVQNRGGLAEAYKDVVHEDVVKVGGSTEAPDYGFRVGGQRKFFVEAKKPSVAVGTDVHPAYKLRRYAWSAKLALSILTDFEEFAVYDCRVRPRRNDKPSTARILYLTFEEYAERWGEIAAIFSKDAVLKGSFDRFAEKGRRRGTATVDEAFLEEIEGWRTNLARGLALRNARLSVRDLNSAVQRTIDRIIFLRMCEDRGIEPGGTLLGLVNGPKIYERLLALFERADDKYNSGLFHFRREPGRDAPDELTPRLRVDDRTLADILRSLYYPESPYEFSVLGADILGQVYEQFLGKVIRLTAGHRAKVEEKPEVKKAGGVYYTPTYIVRYIVEETVGRLLAPIGKGDGEEKGTGVFCRNGPLGASHKILPSPFPQKTPVPFSPREAARLRILDPACGSGSFLIGAYQRLLDWHRDWYVADGPEKHTKEIYKGAGGEWRLTVGEKKRILLDNIYGVDIDGQAVEVTKLSLLLKVLEGENQDSLERQRRLFHEERALPDLESNIKCGNSLIGPDFFDGRQMDLFDEDEVHRVNAFDWEREFPQILGPKVPKKRRGFDAVIGNPPYIRVRIFREIYPEQVTYLANKYRCARHVWDIYLLFFERASNLVRPAGLFSFIVPIQTLHQPNCESLRRILVEEHAIISLADLSAIKVFHNAIVKNCVLVCRKGSEGTTDINIRVPQSPPELLESSRMKWPQARVRQNPGFSLKADLLSPKKDLCEKIRAKSWELSELCYVTFGLRSCSPKRGGGGKDRLITKKSSDSLAKPYLEGREIFRYGMQPSGRRIRYIPEEMYSPRCRELFEAEKIVSQTMLSRARLVATYDNKGYYVEQSLLCVLPHGIVSADKPVFELPLKFILGVMNSRLESFYFATQIIDFSLGGGLIHATPGSQGKLVIPKADGTKIPKMVALVERMLDLNARLAKARSVEARSRIQRLIDRTDREIDKLVYELYGLTEEEIGVVEEVT